jgi:L-lactate dehydrogenase complex protein LldG
MNNNDKARSAILARLEKGVTGRMDGRAEAPPGPFVHVDKLSLIQAFKENLEKVNGSVTILENQKFLAEKISALAGEYRRERIACMEPKIIDILLEGDFRFPLIDEITKETEIMITGCESLVANLGSVIVSSSQAGSRRMFVLPPVHIVVAFSGQIAETLDEAYISVLNRYGKNLPSMISVITGPSRTADIEKTLVLGAHGPAVLHVILIQQEN